MIGLDTFGAAAWQHPLVVGAAFGLLHALDADHLSTLSSLAVGERSVSATGYAARWALGHALALVALSLAVIGIGVSGIDALSVGAEAAVAVLLVGLGLHAWPPALRRRRRRAGVVLHTHARGAGLLMGVLHGGAGSAAVLSLIPLAAYPSRLQGFVYVGSFSIGVAAGALAFSALLMRVLPRAGDGRNAFGTALQAAVAVFAVATGVLLLVEIAHAR